MDWALFPFRWLFSFIKGGFGVGKRMDQAIHPFPKLLSVTGHQN